MFKILFHKREREREMEEAEEGEGERKREGEREKESEKRGGKKQQKRSIAACLQSNIDIV